jgi:hypothetical protein
MAFRFQILLHRFSFACTQDDHWCASRLFQGRPRKDQRLACPEQSHPPTSWLSVAPPSHNHLTKKPSRTTGDRMRFELVGREMKMVCVCANLVPDCNMPIAHRTPSVAMFGVFRPLAVTRRMQPANPFRPNEPIPTVPASCSPVCSGRPQLGVCCVFQYYTALKEMI